MNEKEQLEEVKKIVQESIEKQGHERCWYHPDLFQRLIEVLEVKPMGKPSLPPRKEFEQGCKKYQDEQYKETKTFK